METKQKPKNIKRKSPDERIRSNKAAPLTRNSPAARPEKAGRRLYEKPRCSLKPPLKKKAKR